MLLCRLELVKNEDRVGPWGYLSLKTHIPPDDALESSLMTGWISYNMIECQGHRCNLFIRQEIGRHYFRIGIFQFSDLVAEVQGAAVPWGFCCGCRAEGQHPGWKNTP